MSSKNKYAEVLLPLKLKEGYTYALPEDMYDKILTGSWVEVSIRGKSYTGVVIGLLSSAPKGITLSRIHPIEKIIDRCPVSREELRFWKSIADYYMCTMGEVFKAAYSTSMQKAVSSQSKKARKVKKEKEEQASPLNELSDSQKEATEEIEKAFAEGKNILLHGVTGSGKTEIYMHLARKCMEKGKQVLYLVPEIAISRQLESRLRKCFSDRLMVYHSRQTGAKRKEIINTLSTDRKPLIILGTRSAVLLPFSNLGLIIVDEEHDQSYKQIDPAPRYNGRDAALMLSVIHKASALLGSATPSYESLYNARSGKLQLVVLDRKYHNNLEPEIKIVDTLRERKLGNMRGSFAAGVIKEIGRTVESGNQVMVFRSRRSYAPVVQCTECGAIAKCPNCNVALSYHKYNNSLTCHYCGYSRPFTTLCKECGETALEHKGAGTEKVEEELHQLLPQSRIERFDAQTTMSKTREEKMIKEFSQHKIDILVGTQMITKGFDFDKLQLVVLLNADSLLAVQDFRSDERAIQLITQLLGRAGRRDHAGKLIIQTAQSSHPALTGKLNAEEGLKEREMFAYPPYVRLITLTVKDSNEGRLWNVCRKLKQAIEECGINNFSGPVTPAIDIINGEHIREFWIRLARNQALVNTKKALSRKIELLSSEFKSGTTIIADVDPL